MSIRAFKTFMLIQFRQLLRRILLSSKTVRNLKVKYALGIIIVELVEAKLFVHAL